MKRRAFLGGVGAAGGAALAPRLSRAARGRPGGALERLKQARVAVSARVGAPGVAGGGAGELALGPGGTARRELPAGTLALRASPVASDREAVELYATFKAKAGAAVGTLSLALDFDGWSTDNYLVLPGACYAGNRFESRFVGYPPLLVEPADIGPHVPPIITDIPRLNLHPGPSRLQLAAADLATPAVAIFAPAARLGLILLCDLATALGRTGIGIVESDDRARASVAVATPFVHEGRRAAGGATAPPEHPAAARPGQSITLRARALAFECASVAELYTRLFGARKALTGPTARSPALPFSAAFAAHEARVNARFVAKPGFFAVGERDSAYTIWQSGWSGGLAVTLPLLAAGTAPSRARARQTIAFALSGQAPSGFFHGISDGRTWYDDGFTAPLPPAPPGAWPPRAPAYQHPRWHLARRTADVLAVLVKELGLLERQAAAAPRDPPAPPVPPAWAEAARRAADALARLWERHHQLGQFVDIETGELVVGGSSSVGIAPAALALAAAHFKEPRYLQIAEASARHYYERFVAAGLTCGGPGDALQCPDSESAAALLESFVVLWEATRDRVWIERARATAHLLASWVISYDAPPAGRGCPAPGETRATGAVFTDAQNRTGAPGYAVASGAALFRLYRATGDVALLDLLRDTVRNLAQYLPLAQRAGEGDRRPRPSGDCARADTAAWLETSGGIVPAAGRFDALALLAYTEIPSVYAQTDAGLVFAFDHVEARVRERLAGRLVVSLRNPTETEARLRLYAESAAEAALPLPPDAVLEAPTAVVPAGSTVEVTMPPMTAPAPR
jgi:hypothetical protein